MTIGEIKDRVGGHEYDFLRKPPLGSNVILLGLGGSYAYGTNNENSDVDIRGVATNSANDILTGHGFDQVEDKATDTVIYSLDKIIKLLTNCNPNVIELMGLRPDHYIYVNEIGQALIDNADMFLSKIAVHSFGGYATSQFRRLDNKSARLTSQSEQEQHILNSIINAKYTFPEKYFYRYEDSIDLYVDDAINEDYATEIFMDVSLKHYPLRDYKCMWSEMHNIVKDYSKIGKRNKSAIEHNKLGKHMMHLCRLYLMCFDILEHGKIVTYRDKEHDFLMDVRNGKYLDDNRQPMPEFFDIIDEYERKLEYWKEHTELPEKPDYKRINRFLRDINLSVILRGAE